MPSYISHAIMGENIYQKIKKDDHLLKVPISKKELQGYSLGIDLSTLSTKLKSNPHNQHTKDFLINIIKYIKENHLQEETHIIALLYGHIAHYYLDTFTHPLIYYIEKGTKRTGLIPNHILIEGYLNSYLAKEILNKDIREIKSDYFSQVDLSNKEVKKIVNNTYGTIYKDHNMIQTYQKTINLFTRIENYIEKVKISKGQLIKLSQFNKYLEKNNLSKEEITNSNHMIYQNPVTGKKHQESFLDLYNKALEETFEAINLVNKYLYDSYQLDTLDNVFQGISYNTGVKCSLGNTMKYVRKLKR